MTTPLPSKSEIDRLGERLRLEVSEDDLRLLDEYRVGFAAACEVVVGSIRHSVIEGVTARPAKSTIAIVEKLRRETIRLSQMQDIAGCRVVVKDILRQNTLSKLFVQLFPDALTTDRRAQPSHGYRALHLVIAVDQRFVEIQIRTELQHLWAELSEKLADKFGHEVKYGEGSPSVRKQLDELSWQIDLLELLELGSQGAPRVLRHIEAGKTHFKSLLLELLHSSETQNDFPD